MITIAQRQTALQQRLDRAGETHCAAHGRFQQIVTAIDQMGGALLVRRLLEMFVNTPAVMHQHARVIQAEQRLRRPAATCRIDGVTNGIVRGKGVQPSLATADAPTGLVGRYLPRLANRFLDLFEARIATLRRAMIRASRSRPSHADAEQFAKELAYLSMRKPQPLVEPCHGGVCSRTKLRTGRADCVGRLQCMPALHQAVAVPQRPR